MSSKSKFTFCAKHFYLCTNVVASPGKTSSQSQNFPSTTDNYNSIQSTYQIKAKSKPAVTADIPTMSVVSSTEKIHRDYKYFPINTKGSKTSHSNDYVSFKPNVTDHIQIKAPYNDISEATTTRHRPDYEWIPLEPLQTPYDDISESTTTKRISNYESHRDYTYFPNDMEMYTSTQSTDQNEAPSKSTTTDRIPITTPQAGITKATTTKNMYKNVLIIYVG